MKLSKPPPTGEENYQSLIDLWNDEDMCTFKDFLRWYNNKGIVQTLKAMQKMLAFCHKKAIDMSKLGCTFPNTWQRFVSTNLPVQNSIPLLKPIMTCCEGFEKIWLVVLLSSSHVKL